MCVEFPGVREVDTPLPEVDAFEAWLRRKNAFETWLHNDKEEGDAEK
ncbi:MAG: hypothetical protein IKD01_04805 [Oscillospiraceae bacterium]|nr:hypothetical protein [Oscillospiraceae bacterium]